MVSHKTGGVYERLQVWPCPRMSATVAMFMVQQLQEKYQAVNKHYVAFVDLEKAFDHVSRKGIWWALRSLVLRNGLWLVLARVKANSLIFRSGSPALHRYAGGLITRVLLWSSLERYLC